MKYRLFQYPLPAPPELEDLNAFLAAQRVAAVTQHLVQTAGGAMLVFVVETVAGGGVAAGPSPPKTDYKEELGAEDFPVFSRLRDARKKWAEEEGVPVYTVFTNAQLAEMVKRKVRSMAEMAAIDGVGKARVEKYGEKLLAMLG